MSSMRCLMQQMMHSKASFNDAHDVYHGNTEMAKEYWNKFDSQRKEALKKAFTPEQHAKYLEIVKDQSFKGRE